MELGIGTKRMELGENSLKILYITHQNLFSRNVYAKCYHLARFYWSVVPWAKWSKILDHGTLVPIIVSPSIFSLTSSTLRLHIEDFTTQQFGKHTAKSWYHSWELYSVFTTLCSSLQLFHCFPFLLNRDLSQHFGKHTAKLLLLVIFFTASSLVFCVQVLMWGSLRKEAEHAHTPWVGWQYS